MKYRTLPPAILLALLCLAASQSATTVLPTNTITYPLQLDGAAVCVPFSVLRSEGVVVRADSGRVAFALSMDAAATLGATNSNNAMTLTDGALVGSGIGGRLVSGEPMRIKADYDHFILSDGAGLRPGGRTSYCSISIRSYGTKFVNLPCDNDTDCTGGSGTCQSASYAAIRNSSCAYILARSDTNSAYGSAGPQ